MQQRPPCRRIIIAPQVNIGSALLLATQRPTEEEVMASAAMASWREKDPEVVEEKRGERILLEGEDTDEDYEQLLGRLYSLLGENNPGLAGRTHMTVMTYPSLLREGTKKTVFVNFMESCQKMRRQPKHVMDFLLSEMTATGSLDGQQRLVVKGRFSPRNFEALLRRYIYEYVICNGCKGTDTTMSRENRLLFLRCEQIKRQAHLFLCGSSRSVAPIKAGFIARITRARA